jgi:CDGSH iron-sulfur domain-containing protein 3
MSRSAHAVTLEASKHYRWCDDSHQGPDERPLSFIAPRHEIVWLCGCTNTTTPPFCDGSHRQTL